MLFTEFVKSENLSTLEKVEGLGILALRSTCNDHILVWLKVLAVFDWDLVFHDSRRVFPVEAVDASHFSEVPFLDTPSKLVATSDHLETISSHID